jgi:5-carboxymethyl-2-hydroxymuconate isomerase
MPQITLELSNNIIEKSFSESLAKIHQILTDTLPTQLVSCKSRIIRHREYFIADGDKKHAFAHLTIRILPGRSKAILKSVAEKIIPIFQDSFKQSLINFNLQLSLEILDLPEIYYKI